MTPRRRAATPRKPSLKHIMLQMLAPAAFRTTRVCAQSIAAHSSTSKKLAKSPRAQAKRCLGSVRVGQDGTHLYIARPSRQRNPHYRGSTTRATGSHVTARWEKVYNGRTKKPVKVKDLPRGFPLVW